MSRVGYLLREVQKTSAVAPGARRVMSAAGCIPLAVLLFEQLRAREGTRMPQTGRLAAQPSPAGRDISGVGSCRMAVMECGVGRI